MISISPCRGCANAETRSKEGLVDAMDACITTCVKLACYQKALSIAEKVGVPNLGTCAICRRPDTDTYCQVCRERASAELARRAALTPKKTITHGPRKINLKNMKWFLILKPRDSHKCEVCENETPPGVDVMARHTAPGKGNYRYAHRECLDGWKEMAA